MILFLLMLIFVNSSYAAETYERIDADTVKVISTEQITVKKIDTEREKVSLQIQLNKLDEDYQRQRQELLNIIGVRDSIISTAIGGATSVTGLTDIR